MARILLLITVSDVRIIVNFVNISTVRNPRPSATRRRLHRRLPHPRQSQRQQQLQPQSHHGFGSEKRDTIDVFIRRGGDYMSAVGAMNGARWRFCRMPLTSPGVPPAFLVWVRMCFSPCSHLENASLRTSVWRLQLPGHTPDRCTPSDQLRFGTYSTAKVQKAFRH